MEIQQVSNSMFWYGAGNGLEAHTWLTVNQGATGPGSQDNDYWIITRGNGDAANCGSTGHSCAPTGILIDGLSTSFNVSKSRFHSLYSYFLLGDAIILGPGEDNDSFDEVSAYPSNTALTNGAAAGNFFHIANNAYVQTCSTYYYGCVPSSNGVAGRPIHPVSVYISKPHILVQVDGFQSGAVVVQNAGNAGSGAVATISLTTNGSTAKQQNLVSFGSTTSVTNGVVQNMVVNCGNSTVSNFPGNNAVTYVGTGVGASTAGTVSFQSYIGGINNNGNMAASTSCIASWGFTPIATFVNNSPYTVYYSTTNIAGCGSQSATAPWCVVAPAGGNSQSGISAGTGAACSGGTCAVTFKDLVVPFSGSPTNGDSWTFQPGQPQTGVTVANIDVNNGRPYAAGENGSEVVSSYPGQAFPKQINASLDQSTQTEPLTEQIFSINGSLYLGYNQNAPFKDAQFSGVQIGNAPGQTSSVNLGSGGGSVIADDSLYLNSDGTSNANHTTHINDQGSTGTVYLGNPASANNEVVVGSTNNSIGSTAGIATLTSTTTGTGTTGTYTNVPLTTGGGIQQGSGGIATVTITAGSVSNVVITTPGWGWAVGDTVSYLTAGGTCTGCSTTVATLTATATTIGNAQGTLSILSPVTAAKTVTSQPTAASVTDAGNMGYTVLQGGLSIGLAPNMTIGNNGAISAIATALTTTYAGGIYLYFAQGSLSTTVSTPGYAAGLYYCVMSTTQAGTCYANTVASGSPVAPTSPTVLSSTGVGSYSQVSSVIALLTYTVPANVLGTNGAVEVDVAETNNNSAGTKTISTKYGGTAFATSTPTTALTMDTHVAIRNSGRTGYQTSQGWGISSGTTQTLSVIGPNRGTIDTTANQNVVVSCALNTPTTDFCILESYSIKVFPN